MNTVEIGYFAPPPLMHDKIGKKTLGKRNVFVYKVTTYSI